MLRSIVLVWALCLAASAAASAEEAPVDSLASGVWVMRHEDPASKTVVVEFERFLAMIESPGDEALARATLARLDEVFPDKPVRFLLHTHPHGHSIGAIDPYLARGVTIVTSATNLERIAERSGDPQRFERVALVVSDGFAIEDPSNRLVVRVIDQDEYTVPSDDYTIFELPAQEIVVSGCLYNKPLTHHQVVNERKPALHRFLVDHGCAAKVLVPTNTTGASGYEDLCSLAMLEETLREGLDPADVADRLEAMSLEEIEQQLDALAAEYREITPSAYDLIVCANTIDLRREDLDRSALFFEVALRVFPDDPDVAYYLGRARWKNDQPDQAEAAWARALELAEDEEERKDLEEAIGRVRG